MHHSLPPLPTAFAERTARLLGEEEARLLCEALEGISPVSIRRHPTKQCPLPAETTVVEWCDTGHYLAQRPRFTYDPRFHAGCYYVQEAASMFIEQAFRQMVETPQRLLDLCAAPGGKSTLWRTLLPDGALLVANEPIAPRAWVLAENLTKWGHPDVVVTQAYPADFAPLAGFFDVIAADVPCSGEGMFRKDGEARTEWTVENVALCAERQWQIVRDVWPALRTGGYLVYSTCTFNREENEDNVERICKELGAELVPIPCDAQWQVSGDTTGRGLPVYHFFPHRAKGEGFFLALLQKTAEQPTLREKKRKREVREQPVTGSATVSQWLKDQQNFKILRNDEAQLYAVRKTLADAMQTIEKNLRTLTVGVALAEEKGRKLIPQHALALSTACAEQAFPHIALTEEQALAYLRHEAITLTADAPRGYVVVCYDGHPLGFVNNLGSRANNMYPSEWRIRN